MNFLFLHVGIFIYTSDFDKKGVIYSFGTGFNSSNNFVNPASEDNCRIRVARSSDDKGHAMDMLDVDKSKMNQLIHCCTKDIPHSWWQVDFGEEHALFVTHYTLRHGSDKKMSMIRNWNLEGSHDGTEWKILRKHEKDRSMGTRTSSPFTCTWTVEKRVQAMRYFRIHQTGKNSAGNNALFLSGFELYGVLIDTCADI